MVGTGGEGLRNNWSPTPEWSAYHQASRNGFASIYVKGGEYLHWQYITDDNLVSDEFYLCKKEPCDFSSSTTSDTSTTIGTSTSSTTTTTGTSSSTTGTDSSSTGTSTSSMSTMGTNSASSNGDGVSAGMKQEVFGFLLLFVTIVLCI